MKRTIYSAFIFILFLISCNSGAQNDAVKTAQSIQSQREKFSPGMVATTADGYTMTAKLNGKPWTANAMYPPNAAGRISGSLGKESIGLPYSSSGYRENQVIKFHEGNAVDLFTDDEVGIWGATTGQMQITKVSDKWVEGTFYFTATTSSDPSKSFVVTDGFFRIPAKQ